ncbi:hypothetical protein YC2023_098809 [Brassica napus]
MQSLDSSRSLSNPVSGKQPSGATRLSAGCDVHHGTMPCLTLENGFQIRDVQSLRTMSNIRIASKHETTLGAVPHRTTLYSTIGSITMNRSITYDAQKALGNGEVYKRFDR